MGLRERRRLASHMCPGRAGELLAFSPACQVEEKTSHRGRVSHMNIEDFLLHLEHGRAMEEIDDFKPSFLHRIRLAHA